MLERGDRDGCRAVPRRPSKRTPRDRMEPPGCPLPGPRSSPNNTQTGGGAIPWPTVQRSVLEKARCYRPNTSSSSKDFGAFNPRASPSLGRTGGVGSLVPARSWSSEPHPGSQGPRMGTTLAKKIPPPEDGRKCWNWCPLFQATFYGTGQTVLARSRSAQTTKANLFEGHRCFQLASIPNPRAIQASGGPGGTK